MVQAVLWAPAILLSLPCTLALSKYYTATLSVYAELQPLPYVVDADICTNGEWYRFLSSFDIPTSAESYGFLPSPFEELLPQPFTSNGSGPGAFYEVQLPNTPEPHVYLPMDDCEDLVDLWKTTDCRGNGSIWRPEVRGTFLDADKTCTLHRIVSLCLALQISTSKR